MISCSPSGPHKPVGGEGGPAFPASVGYDSVRPIFANYCAACHPSRSGPDWLDYSQAQSYAKNGKLLHRVVEEKSMPPPGSAQAAAITELQRRTLGNWARAGGPQRLNGQSQNAPPPPPETEAEHAVKQCLHCHGTIAYGPAPQTKYPRLAGQNEAYLIAELQRFKWRERIDPSQTMNDLAADLSDHDISLVAEYYAKGKGNGLATEEIHVKPEEAALFETGKRKAGAECIACHQNFQSANRPLDPRFPVIAGQSKKYLINQLIYFRSQERPGNIMREMAKNLSNADIEALALYFSSL